MRQMLNFNASRAMESTSSATVHFCNLIFKAKLISLLN